MSKKIITMLFIIPFLMLLSSCAPSTSKEVPDKNEEDIRIAFSEEIQVILNEKISIIKNLVSDPLIVKAVQVSNEKHKNIDMKKIEELDEKWRKAEEIDDFVRSFMENPCAVNLMKFQGKNDGFVEVFIADAKGLNVCQTNKTSDYYQADEEWWTKGFNKGSGHAYFGEMEYDESSQSEAISLYIPVVEPQTQRAVGVCKAVYNVDKVKEEL